MGAPAWVAIAVGAVLLLVAVDRAVAAGWFDRRRPRPRPAPREGSGVASGLLGDLVEVFQPSRHHVTDEQDRHALDIRQAPVEGPPDLEAGVIVLPPAAAVRAAGSTPATPAATLSLDDDTPREPSSRADGPRGPSSRGDGGR